MKKILVFKKGKIERELGKEEFYSLFEKMIVELSKKRVGREGKIIFGNFSPIKIFVFGEDSLTKKFLKYMYDFVSKSIKATCVPCEAMNRYCFVAFDLEDCSFDDKKVLKSYWELHNGISFVRTNMFSFGNSVGMFGDGIYVQLGYSNDCGILNF